MALVVYKDKHLVTTAPWIIRPGMPVQNRYVWCCPANTRAHGIPKNWPENSGRTIYVKPMIRLALSETGLTKETSDYFTFGWSPDGMHWVLFGLDDENPRDALTMREFPTMLRIACKDTLEIRGPASKIAPVLESMKRAFAAREL